MSDGESGLVVPSLSPRALADQMARMMSLPVEARRQMGRNGRANLLRRLSSKVNAHELASLYEEALAPRDDEALVERADARATG